MKKILPLSTFPVVIGVIILVVLFNGISSRNSFASLQSGQFVKTKTEVPSFESRLIALRIRCLQDKTLLFT